MDRGSVERHAEDHAQAVVRGDMEAVIADFVPELRPQVPELAKGLPQPTTSADVQSVQDAGDHAVVEIRYSGAEQSLTIRTRWEDREGRPLITEAAPSS
jgi:hypothetical protein